MKEGLKNLGIKLGCDPEVFLFKDGKPISAIGKICGTKEKPFPISKEGHSVLTDNVMLEFNVPPSTTSEEMYRNITYVMEWFKYKFPQKEGYQIRKIPVAIFPKSELQHPEAQKFGCDPDYNVWEEDVNPAPDPNTDLRTAGGHIHVSYPDANIGKSLELIKLFDLFLGVPSVIKDVHGKERRKMYGGAGAFRFKTYGEESGFEYRTLSNFWINDLKRVDFIFTQVEKVFNAYNDGLRLNDSVGIKIQNAINLNDVDLAKWLIKEYKVYE